MAMKGVVFFFDSVVATLLYIYLNVQLNCVVRLQIGVLKFLGDLGV